MSRTRAPTIRSAARRPTRSPSLLLADPSYLSTDADELRRQRVLCSISERQADPARPRRAHREGSDEDAFASPGAMTVDWEERVNPDRLRTYRFGRAKAALAASDLGAVLLFDFNNIRYVTSTHIGEWARDKMTRYALQTRGGTPHIWDFGSAAKHHRLNCPWLRPGEHPRRDGRPARRRRPGRRPVPSGRARDRARSCAPRASLDMPLGVDIVEPPMVAALEAEGITVRDAQQVMLDAREVKSIDEIMLLNTACSMVDGAYQMLAEQLKPGVRESELVANVTKFLFDLGLGARRQHQRGLGRALQPASARLQRPDHPARRPGVLRHHPHVRRLQDLLLPDVRGRARRPTPSATPTSRPASGSTRRSS